MKVFTKSFSKDQVGQRPPCKPFSHPKSEKTSQIDKGKAMTLPSPKELPN